MKGPLLSICIPTYNREKYLKRLLDSIVCQKEFSETNDVEIVVDDGPSSDNTESMVKEYIKKYWNKIKYYRNPVRIGMCPAFLEAFSLWTGRYLWLIWSDDTIAINALNCMLKAIISFDSKLILCKRYWIDKRIKWKKGEEENFLSFNWFSDFSTYLWYSDGETYHKDTYFTFISVFCINKDYFHNSYSFLKSILSDDYIKSHYFNFSFIWYSNLHNNDTITVIKQPYMIYYWSDNNTSRNLNRKIIKDLHDEMKFLWNTYPISKNWKKTMGKIVFWRWMSLYILPVVRKICKLPILKSIYSYFSKRHIKNMWIE